MGTLTFMDGSTMPLESASGTPAIGTLYLRVKVKISELSVFEDQNKTQTMKCSFDGIEKTYRGYTTLMDIIPEDGVIRVGMRKSYV